MQPTSYSFARRRPKPTPNVSQSSTSQERTSGQERPAERQNGRRADAQPERRTDQAPDVNEAADLAWIDLDDALRMIGTGEIIGAATVVALYALQVRRATRPA